MTTSSEDLKNRARSSAKATLYYYDTKALVEDIKKYGRVYLAQGSPSLDDVVDFLIAEEGLNSLPLYISTDIIKRDLYGILISDSDDFRKIILDRLSRG
jgi:hypothetical protein